jgi:YVTN family beta-propeller protein
MNFRVSKFFAFAAVAALASLAAQAQTITSQISIGSAEFIQGIAANPTTNQTYASVLTLDSTNDALAVIDGSTDTVQATIPVPVGAQQLAVNILTNQVYIATCNSYVTPAPCSVTVVDGNSQSVVTSIPIATTYGNGLSGIAVDPITFKVYVADDVNNVIDIINGLTNKVTGTIALNGQSPQGIAFNPIDRLLYVTYGSNQVSIINPAKKTIIGTSTVGVSTFNAAANLVTGNVYVTDVNYSASAADVLSATGTVLAQVATDNGAWGVDVDPITNLAFVANLDFGSVTAINGSTNTAINTVPVVPAQFVAVNFATEKVYVAGGSTVTVLTEK